MPEYEDYKWKKVSDGRYLYVLYLGDEYQKVHIAPDGQIADMWRLHHDGEKEPSKMFKLSECKNNGIRYAQRVKSERKDTEIT